MIKEFNEWVSKNLDSQKGKTAIVTGANSGIGFYTALGLAKLGATVIVAGRNKVRNCARCMTAMVCKRVH